MLKKLSELFGRRNQSPDDSIEARIDQLLPEFKKQSGLRIWYYDPQKLPIASSLLADSANQVEYAIAIGKRLKKNNTAGGDSDERQLLAKVLTALVRKKMAITAENLPRIVDVVADVGPHYVPQGVFLKHVDRFLKTEELPADGVRALKRWTHIRNKSQMYKSPDQEKITRRIKQILGQDVGIVFDPGDPFGKQAIESLKSFKGSEAEQWTQLAEIASTASGSKPSDKIVKQTRTLIASIGEESVAARLAEWFNLVCKQEPKAYNYSVGLVNPHNSAIVKGLIWFSSLIDNDALIRSVAGLTVKAFQKVPQVGPASLLLGNACIYALAHAPGFKGIPHLSRLKFRIRHNQASKLIAKYLREISEASGMTSDDLEDITVPDFGLEDGCLTEEFGGCKARLTIESVSSVKVEWFGENGKTVKSVPAKVKSDFKEEYKAFTQTVKDIPQMLGGQRDRIDKFFIKNRSMPFGAFEERFLRHGLMSALGKNLIWQFEEGDKTGAGILLNGKFSNPTGAKLDWIKDTTSVRLWHPIGRSIEEVVSWRHFIEENEIVQPFKQAHREVYIVTEAELRTGTYSNRFAAHLLRQHQMSALARTRGWSYALMGAFDDGKEGDAVKLSLPEHNLSVEYWVNKVYENEQWNDTGILNYVATDQVRFLRDGQAVPVDSVNAVVFSEALRDVDLFVGVASVGNDPTWVDSAGITTNQRAYWQGYAFGEMSESGKMRRQVLETLLPRLKIRDQCTLQDRFLRVQGKLRAYKIHLGSANIMMEPNDQYLCIVPSRGKDQAGKVWLPFEGDGGLAIILSKAFLLAEDDKIKDETITRQIKQG